MRTWIALLRGINVGGRNKLPMKELSALLEGVGCLEVRTYIQSGNVVFRADDGVAGRLAAETKAAILEKHGFEPGIFVLTREDIDAAIASNPYPEAEVSPSTLHVGFLEVPSPEPGLEKLGALRAESERFCLTDRFFYLHAPEGVGRSKLAASAERLIGAAMTVRNWRTVCRLRDLADQLEPL